MKDYCKALLIGLFDYRTGWLCEYIEPATPVSIYGGAGLQCAG